MVVVAIKISAEADALKCEKEKEMSDGNFGDLVEYNVSTNNPYMVNRLKFFLLSKYSLKLT